MQSSHGGGSRESPSALRPRHPNYSVRPVALANNTHFSYIELSHPGETALELNYEGPMGICSLSGIKPSILQNTIKSIKYYYIPLQATLDCTPCSVHCKQPSPIRVLEPLLHFASFVINRHNAKLAPSHPA